MVEDGCRVKTIWNFWWCPYVAHLFSFLCCVFCFVNGS